MKAMLNEQLARKEYFWFAPALERFEAEDKALIRRVKVQFTMLIFVVIYFCNKRRQVHIDILSYVM